jgi:hypothetical protein
MKLIYRGHIYDYTPAFNLYRKAFVFFLGIFPNTCIKRSRLYPLDN